MLKNVYLIDDDSPTNYLNEIIVKKLDITEKITVFTNAMNALEHIKMGFTEDNPAPELILLDISMPLMDGWDFLEQLKVLDAELNFTPKVIMLTTSLDPSDEVKSKTSDYIVQFVHKPLNEIILRNIIKNIFPS